MIGRIWHGWTRPENADRYEQLLKEEIFPSIAEKGVRGYKGIQLLRRPIAKDEVEFVTIMWFDSWDAVKQSPARTTRMRTCLRQHGRYWRGSMNVHSTTRLRNT